MPKLEVITVEWVNDREAHIYPPGSYSAWWMRPVPRYGSDGEVWELHNDSDDEAQGYFDLPEDAATHVSEQFDGAPVVVVREREL